jgi:hypothetical protein
MELKNMESYFQRWKNYTKQKEYLRFMVGFKV